MSAATRRKDRQPHPSTCWYATISTDSHLVIDVIDRVPGLARRAATVCQRMVDKFAEHHDYVRQTGEDLPEVTDWVWTGR
jgi:phosphoketolase